MAFRFLIVLSVCFLSACSSLEHTNTSQHPTNVNEWIDPDTLLERESLYCYKTLGSADCYQTPQRNQISRLEGYYGPPPL